jgi:hypothetical protein
MVTAASRDPVLEAAESAPMGPPESDEERAAVLAAMAEAVEGAPSIDHDEVLRKLAARR